MKKLLGICPEFSGTELWPMNFDFFQDINQDVAMQYYLKLSENLKHNGITYSEGLNQHRTHLRRIEEIQITGFREKLAYGHHPAGVPLGTYVSAIHIDSIINITEHPEYFEICLRSVAINGFNLQFIPDEYQTEELCRIAVRQCGLAIGHVKNQTTELCEIAVRRNGWALRYVKPIFRTRELCRIAVRRSGEALQYVSQDFITAELCEIAVRRNGQALKFVPIRFKTYDICVVAVARNSRAVQFLS